MSNFQFTMFNKFHSHFFKAPTVNSYLKVITVRRTDMCAQYTVCSEVGVYCVHVEMHVNIHYNTSLFSFIQYLLCNEIMIFRVCSIRCNFVLFACSNWNAAYCWKRTNCEPSNLLKNFQSSVLWQTNEWLAFIDSIIEISHLAVIHHQIERYFRWRTWFSNLNVKDQYSRLLLSRV